MRKFKDKKTKIIYNVQTDSIVESFLKDKNFVEIIEKKDKSNVSETTNQNDNLVNESENLNVNLSD